MDARDRRLAAILAALAGFVVLFSVGTMAATAPGYVRWSHAGVLVAAAVTFILAAVAYLYGTRNAVRTRTPQEICTAYYLAAAAWKPPLVFGGQG